MMAITPEVVAKLNSFPVVLIFLLVGAIILGGIFTFWYLIYTPNRLRRKLRKLSPLLGKEPVETLKENYLAVYNLYLKLSEPRKQNFYSKVTKLREVIEEQLKAEKRIEELFLKVNNATEMLEQKKIYLEIDQYYQKLPEKTQRKYYPLVSHLRELLEKGTKSGDASREVK